MIQFITEFPLLTVQIVIGTWVFFKLNGYNALHEKQFLRAQAHARKPSATLFELPAFRGKVEAPFENTTWRLTRYEQIKLMIMSVTFFPLRFICFCIIFVGDSFIVFLLMSLGLRKLAKAAVAFGSRCALFAFGYYWIDVKGKPAEGVGVLVSNHCSFLDGLVWVAISTPRIFAEKTNFSNPLLKIYARALDIVLFDRGGQESRRQARKLMSKAAAESVHGNKPPILVFPTGTTTNLRVLITFKDGAFAPGLPVQPAVLRYKFRHCDPAWVFTGPSTVHLAFRVMCQLVNWLEVEFLPICVPTEKEKEEPHEFARRVQLQVAEAMGVPVTHHSVEDLQLQFAAVKANLPPEVGVVGFPALKEVFSVDANQIKQQMHVFKEMDHKGSGLVGFEDFKASFQRGFHTPSQEQTKLLEEFFYQLTGGSAMLDFRKFLIGLALVNENEKGTEDEAMGAKVSTKLPLAAIKGKIYSQLAFAAFAAESDDRISWREFKELWNWLHPAGVHAKEDSCASQKDDKRRGSSCFAGIIGASAADDVVSSARQVYEQIGGDTAEDLTWEKFSAYTDRNPDFEKRLRQAFFSRVASDLAPENKT
mmetsp:Transcript_9992/g.26514  ORF Transcript_9992/g.26514 Transcript_9992/m.26514 type:complete len:591 (-) Transcript_9992:118-1890(-)